MVDPCLQIHKLTVQLYMQVFCSECGEGLKKGGPGVGAFSPKPLSDKVADCC